MLYGLNVYVPSTLFLTPMAMVSGSGVFEDHVMRGDPSSTELVHLLHRPFCQIFFFSYCYGCVFCFYFTLLGLYITLTDF